MSLQADLFGSQEEHEKNQGSKFEEFDSEFAEYTLVDTPEKLEEMAQILWKTDRFAFDTETTGYDPVTDRLLGVSIASDEGVAWYAPFINSSVSESKFRSVMEPLFDSEIAKIAHNYKFDAQFLEWNDIAISGAVFDTMVAGYLLDHDQKLKMDKLSRKYLSYDPISIDTLFQGNQTMADVPVSQASIYACEDADVTYRLFKVLNQKLKDEGMSQLAYNIEFPVTKVLARMETNGVKINTNFMESYLDELSDKIDEIETKMYEMAGGSFNPRSPQQVGNILFDKLGLPVVEKTDTGNRATGEDTLNELKHKHEFPKLMLEHRKLSKLYGTYLKPIPEKVNVNTGRLHTSLNQTRTTTGRLSSSEPNLQNIPIRTEEGRKVRKAFVAPEDKYLLSADYSQMELRIIASICQDERMLEIFREGKDIHSGTAAETLEKPIEEVTEDERYDYKTVNYAIPYGADYPKISRELEIPKKSAKALLEGYFNKFSGMKRYIDAQHEFVEEHGYVETRFGRRRYLPAIYSSNDYKKWQAQRQAVNMPIQGESADIMKLAMKDVAKYTQDRPEVKILLQIHDELLLEIPKENSDIVSSEIVSIMENAHDIGVPLTVDHGISKTWFEGH